MFLRFVRESKFDAKIKLIAETYQRMDELDQAIEWGLSRNPKRFNHICADFYLWKTEKLIGDIPQLRILYRYAETETPKTIYLVEADVVDDD
jgi:hypothetical protein